MKHLKNLNENYKCSLGNINSINMFTFKISKFKPEKKIKATRQNTTKKWQKHIKNTQT